MSSTNWLPLIRLKNSPGFGTKVSLVPTFVEDAPVSRVDFTCAYLGNHQLRELEGNGTDQYLGLLGMRCCSGSLFVALDFII